MILSSDGRQCEFLGINRAVSSSTVIGDLEIQALQGTPGEEATRHCTLQGTPGEEANRHCTLQGTPGEEASRHCT